MTERHDSDMPEDVLELIEKERAYPDLSDGEIEEIRASVQRVIAQGPELTPAQRWLRQLGVLGCGAIVGAGAYATLMPPKVVVETRETVRVERVEVPAPPAPSAPSAPIAPTSEAAPDALPVAPQSSEAPSRSVRGTDLAATAEAAERVSRERTLIEQARSALARGEYDAALTAASRHAAQFATGELAEERDAIRIQAFVLSGDRDAAAALATSFRRRYPMSLHTRTLERLLSE